MNMVFVSFINGIIHPVYNTIKFPVSKEFKDKSPYQQINEIILILRKNGYSSNIAIINYWPS